MIRVNGQIIEGCPVAALPLEVWEMLTWYSDWELGHTPVTIGRAPWLPTQFVQAMHEVRSAKNQSEADKRARNK